MVAFSKPINELPSAIQAVLNSNSNNGNSRINNKTKVAASIAAVSIAAYITNYIYKKQAETSYARATSRKADLYDGPVSGNKYTLTVPYKNRTAKVTIRPTPPETFKKHKKLFALPANGTQRVGVNKIFFGQLSAIFKIILPKVRSKEVIILLLHSIFLVLRSWLSIVVARLDGRIVRDLVAANGKEFLKGIAYWFLIAIPATYTNSMIRFFQSKLSIAFRTRLTRYVNDLYLNDQNAYYKAINLDNRIEGADQLILDTVIFNYQLTKSIGLLGMLGLFGNYIVTAWILRKVTPAFGKLAAIEAKLEGDFRAAHTRLITNAEEIAFYHGAVLEHSILERTYIRLVKHINSIFKIRIAYNMFEDFVIKYCWSAIGLLVCSVPVFFPAYGGRGGKIEMQGGSKNYGKERDRTKSFITNKRLMITLADAGGRMMYSYKELAELAGYTSRVYNLLSVLHSLYASEYVATLRPASFPEDQEFYSLDDVRGEILYGYNGIKFEGVPIVTPNPGNARGGDELIKGLNIVINPGEHLLVTGPNGVGKTSVARVISKLWPVFRGVLSRPNVGDIFYIPQRPYLSIGTLRDQIIYPHSYADMIRANRTDEELMDILQIVHLAYIPDREGGWETKKEWKDVFSGGEKQRVGMARLFYHNPKFAILDECTSAVSSDVEGLMYQHAKDVGITLVTISHRPSLFKYHTHLLLLSGDEGSWKFETIGTKEERMSLDNEVAALESKLKDVESDKARIEEINKELQLGISKDNTTSKVQRRGLVL
ncbi:5786_t:CDS:10 [Funneliformis geosporum]|uniref:19734_t:CDS:1 n=1 Tax=Funneliformis geosporum TaxID=1117311 RepID=A0A9W4WU93_9GLOM|nr:19734_t:CDS:10 [Funneliformis geosporum]CAI2167352.1 5786_t:CDS:10 [Funneliformis geosporum]